MSTGNPHDVVANNVTISHVANLNEVTRPPMNRDTSVT